MKPAVTLCVVANNVCAVFQWNSTDIFHDADPSPTAKSLTGSNVHSYFAHLYTWDGSLISFSSARRHTP
jgi:hypothetical protein